MIKKVLISFCIFILYTTNVMAQTNHQIKIIDIKKGKVIKNVQKTPDLQQEVEKFLEGISGVYVKLNPYPNNGFVIKIPLEPNVTVKNQWFNDLVDEVMIIFLFKKIHIYWFLTMRTDHISLNFKAIQANSWDY